MCTVSQEDIDLLININFTGLNLLKFTYLSDNEYVMSLVVGYKTENYPLKKALV